MKYIPVKSSTVEAIGYDYDNSNLHVQFVNGREYIYGNVPCQVYAKFLEADSKGRYLNEAVVGRFNYVRIK